MNVARTLGQLAGLLTGGAKIAGVPVGVAVVALVAVVAVMTL
ncbi:hypothetical protein [Halostella salina]|nr:hypothetical protein [Halostella salina]